MTELSTDQLKKSFHQEIINLYKKIMKSIKYKPTRLMDYINKYGGYEAAVKYISTESNVQDFAVLWEKERLDLSVEALITSETYRSLFQEELVAFCDHKLKEYSYAPNKIEEVEEPTGYFDEDEKIDLAELLKQKELYLPKVEKKEYPMYHQAVGVKCDEWKEIITNTKVVTANNLDLLLRIYAIGDAVGPKELAKEEGYSTTYPYKEVIMALGKRIKTYLKIDVPVGDDGKPLWWHILFNGGLKDNSDFEWSLRRDLREAFNELIDAGIVEKLEVQSQKEIKNIEEKVIHKTVEKAKSTNVNPLNKEDALTAFDRLFESIMATPTPEKLEEPPREERILDKPSDNTVQSSHLETKEEVVERVDSKSTLSAVEGLPEVANKTCEHTPSIDEELDTDYKVKLKKECLDYYGAICDICGFDFGYTYGEAFEQCIDVHNQNSVEGEEILPTTHPTEDLIPICHNCHHIIHSTVPAISVEKMRKMVKA